LILPIDPTIESPQVVGGLTKGQEMKASIYRIFGSSAVISALILALGAPKKWG